MLNYDNRNPGENKAKGTNTAALTWLKHSILYIVLYIF